MAAAAAWVLDTALVFDDLLGLVDRLSTLEAREAGFDLEPEGIGTVGARDASP